MTPTAFGSSAWRRWKSALAGNSSVTTSASRAVGRASPRSDASGIERDWTAGRTVRCPRVLQLLEGEGRRVRLGGLLRLGLGRDRRRLLNLRRRCGDRATRRSDAARAARPGTRATPVRGRTRDSSP